MFARFPLSNFSNQHNLLKNKNRKLRTSFWYDSFKIKLTLLTKNGITIKVTLRLNNLRSSCSKDNANNTSDQKSNRLKTPTEIETSLDNPILSKMLKLLLE